MNSTDDLYELAQELGEHLLRLGLVVTTAESCTGGWIAKVLTDVPGSSAWFSEGFVTYSNAAKQRRLLVDATTLATHGAVSAEVVTQMATGALHEAGADLAVAVSGVAGPDGGSDDKPVGTVWVAWGFAGRSAPPPGNGRRAARVRVQRFQFQGDRDAVRRATVAKALHGLLLVPTAGD